MERKIEQILHEISEFSSSILKIEAKNFDQTCEYPEAIMKYLFDYKLLHLMLTHNGLNGTFSDLLKLIRIISKNFASVGSILLTQATCGVFPMVEFGTTIQKLQYLEKLISGEIIGSFALNETDSGSYVKHIRTTAVKTEIGWKINGKKISISNAPVANIFYVVARIEQESNEDQFGIFIVDKAVSGLKIDPPSEKVGVRALPVSSIELNDVIVNEQALLGNEFNGANQVEKILNILRIAIASQSIGIAQGAMEIGFKHVTYDRRFGQRLIDLQDIQIKMADSQTKIAAAKSSLDYVLNHDLQDTVQVSMLKLIASNAATEVTETIMQVTGGYAFMKNNEIERFVRDAQVTAIYGGSASTQRRIISLPWLKK